MEQAAHRSCGCSMSACIQGWVGWAFGQPDLVGDVLPMTGRLEPDDLEYPFQPKQFYDYMKIMSSKDNF